MIVGTVNIDGVPVIILTVAGQTWPATIDTGFNSDLELPDILRPFVNPRFICQVRWLLAGEQNIEEDQYLVDFPFDGQTVRAEATFTPGGEILIGTHLLREYRLEINFVERTVVLERVGEIRTGVADGDDFGILD
jgi:predicted aspartyl protease